MLTITSEELARLARLERLHGVHLRVIRHSLRWIIDFANNGGQCPFLDLETNLCRIHPERPDACRKFPERYESRCILFG